MIYEIVGLPVTSKAPPETTVVLNEPVFDGSPELVGKLVAAASEVTL